MLVKREKIEKDVELILQIYNGRKKKKEEIIKKFEERGFLFGEINALFTGSNEVKYLSDEMLCLFVWILYHEIYEDTLKSSINPNKTLTPKEIELSENYIFDHKTNNIYPIVFENVNLNAEDDYSTVLYADQLANLINKGIIKYNAETQRPYVTHIYKGREVKRIDLNPENKKAIQKNIINGDQIPNTITLNIAGDDFVYYSESKRLEINCFINPLDGYHRLCSARDAFMINPNINFYLIIRIVHWDEERAKQFVYQESLGMRLNSQAQKSRNVINPANIIVTKLNENPRSNLRKRITFDKSSIDKGNYIIRFDVFFDCIKYLFTVNNTNITEITNYIREGLNFFTDENPELLKEKQNDRLWIAYFIILSKYYRQEDWQTKIIDFVDNKSPLFIKSDELNYIQYKSVNGVVINKITTHINNKIGGIKNAI
jgi:hypothetical protein